MIFFHYDLKAIHSSRCTRWTEGTGQTNGGERKGLELTASLEISSVASPPCPTCDRPRFHVTGIHSCCNVLLWTHGELAAQSETHCASPALAFTYHPLLALPYKPKYVLVQQLLTEVELHFSPRRKHNSANNASEFNNVKKSIYFV